MASVFGHITSIIGIKKIFPDKDFGTKALLLGSLCSIIPDIDVISERFGIISADKYDILAHRGFTHSILFGIIWTTLILLIFHRKEQKKYFILGVFYFICTCSHGILDSMTNGGDGISFFFPINTERYFLPIRVIEVSPLGISSFLSEWGLQILINEFKYIGIPAMILYFIGSIANKNIYK